MALTFPWEMYLQAAQQKNQNRQQMNQDIAGFGQNIGQGVSSIADAIQQQKKKKAWQDAITSLMQPATPQTAGMGGLTSAPPQASSGMASNPMFAKIAPLLAQEPSLAGQLLPELLKPQTPKTPLEWAPVPGMISPNKKPLFYDKTTGQMREGDLPGKSIAGDKPPSSYQDQLRQDRLEKTYSDRVAKVVQARTGGLGLQDTKVNQAIDLRTLLNQYYDPNTGQYNVPPAQHAELAIGLARLLSPSGTVGVQMEEMLRQKTLREGLAGAIIYLGGDPKKIGGSTQSVIQMFRDSIDRQGETAEKLRDKYMNGLKTLRPKGLDPEIADQIASTNISSSFNEFLDQSPDRKKGKSESSGPYAGMSDAALDKRIAELQGAK